jgi:nuclear pore complex protein Nup155
MGLMPEIDRAWVTIDNKLFLWDYVEGCATGQFAPQTSELILLSTDEEISSFSDQPVTGHRRWQGSESRFHKERVKMYATDMSVSTDVEMTSVVGTADGRIFMCGSQDGCLYELHYQEKEGWFGKRVQLINHSVGGVQTLFPKLMGKSDGAQVLNDVLWQN